MSNREQLSFNADDDDVDSTIVEDAPDAQPLRVLSDSSRWRNRDVEDYAGSWKQLAKRIPEFALRPFRVGNEGPANPNLMAVVRQPVGPAEQAIPVGVVSNNYTLVQHRAVIEACFDALRREKIDPESLECELGMTSLGEWINFRINFPPRYDYQFAENDALNLRLEIFNSVEGSSRLTVLLGWFRFVCANGLVIGETLVSLRDIHNLKLNIMRIPEAVTSGLNKVQQNQALLDHWASTLYALNRFRPWIDNTLAKRWNAKAACRALHICRHGYDVLQLNDFDKSPPSEMRTLQAEKVPGSFVPARTLFEVSQALAWLATKRNNPDERMEWQSQIAELIGDLERGHVG